MTASTNYLEQKRRRQGTRSSPLNSAISFVLLGLVALAWSLTWQGTLGMEWSKTLLVQSGKFSYYLLAFTSTIGPLIGTRFLPNWLNASVKTGWHGVISGFALTLGLIHGLFTMVGRGSMSLPEVLIPGLAPSHTLAMAAGTTGLWLMLAVYVTYALRHLIGMRAARVLHLLAYPAFIASTLHAVWLGHGGIDIVYILSSVAVGLALLVRLGTLARR